MDLKSQANAALGCETKLVLSRHYGAAVVNQFRTTNSFPPMRISVVTFGSGDIITCKDQDTTLLATKLLLSQTNHLTPEEILAFVTDALPFSCRLLENLVANVIEEETGTRWPDPVCCPSQLCFYVNDFSNQSITEWRSDEPREIAIKVAGKGVGWL